MDEAIENPEQVVWVANEGVRVSRPVAGLKDAALEEAAFEKVRAELLALWQQPDVMLRSRPLGTAAVPSRPRHSEAGLEGHAIAKNAAGVEGHVLEVPITLAIRIGSPRLPRRE